MGLFEIVDVFINDTIYPYVNNNVRDNNIKHIKEFTRMEIQMITNGSFFLSSIKYSLYVMVSISQIDVVLIKVLIGEITCIFTTSIQLSNKTFMNNSNNLQNCYELVKTDEKTCEKTCNNIPDEFNFV